MHSRLSASSERQGSWSLKRVLMTSITYIRAAAAGRIENVEIEVVGIIPSSGISGILTNSGISGYRIPASASDPGTSGLKYRLQSKETLVIVGLRRAQ